MRVVRPYLPGGSAPSKFSEGGALFALGLIYAGRKEGCEDELRKGLAEGNDPIVQHGAALGLGVSGIATADDGESPLTADSKMLISRHLRGDSKCPVPGQCHSRRSRWICHGSDYAG